MYMQRPDNILPFCGGGECPVQYWLGYQGCDFYIRYRDGWLSLDVADHEVFEKRIGGPFDSTWTDEETNAYLTIFSEMIECGQWSNIDVPTLYEIRVHPSFKKGSLPMIDVGLKCGKKEDLDPGSQPFLNRHGRQRLKKIGVHFHTMACIMSCTAQEVEQWVRLHPAQHALYLEKYAGMWNYYLRRQATTVDENNIRHWPLSI